MDARLGSNSVALHQRAARLSLARRTNNFEGLDPPKLTAKKESLEEVFANIQLQRELSEALHVCDVLETLIDDPDAGFDEGLFVACEHFIAQNEIWETDEQGKDHKEKDPNSVSWPTSLSERFFRTLEGTSDRPLPGGELDTSTTSSSGRVDVDDSGQQRRKPSTLQQRMMLFFENPSSSMGSRIYFVLMSLTVIASCVFVVVETLPQYNPVVFPSMAAMWSILDWAVTLLFTVETGLRLILHINDDTSRTSKLQNAWMFLKRPSNIVDIVSLLPTYFTLVYPQQGRIVSGTLRTTRLLRLLKFLRRFRPIRRLVTALQRSATSLLAPFLFLSLCLLLFGAWLFFTERGIFDPTLGSFTLISPQCLSEPYGFLEKFANLTVNSTVAGQVVTSHCPVLEPKFISITQTLWWGIVTFTTVGFGDLVPLTPLGKIIAGAGMIVGLIFISMPIAVLGTNYTVVMEQKGAEKERQREMSARAKPISRNEKPPTYTLPGENFLQFLKDLSGKTIIDLRDPGDATLYLIDRLLESSIKQLTSMVSQSSDHAETNSNAGPFAMNYTDLGLPLDTMPLWCARVHTRFPGGERKRSGTKQGSTAADTLAASRVSQSAMEKRKSDLRRGVLNAKADPLSREEEGNSTSDGQPPTDFESWTNAEADDATVTLSRPITLRVGSTHQGQASAMRPDVVIYDESVARHLHATQNASLLPEVGDNTEDLLGLRGVPDRHGTDLDELPLVPIASTHFTLTRTMAWGEHRMLVRPQPGCPIAVLRLKTLASEKSRTARAENQGIMFGGGSHGSSGQSTADFNLDCSVEAEDPFFGISLPDTGVVSKQFFYKGKTSSASPAGRRLSISRTTLSTDSEATGAPSLDAGYHLVGSFNTGVVNCSAAPKSRKDKTDAAIRSALNPDSSDQLAKQQHSSALEHLETVVAGELPFIGLQDKDIIVAGSFIPHHLPYILTALVEGEPVPQQVGGPAASDRVLFFQYSDNTSNFMV